jgi:aldose 1-epimerase
MSVELAAGPARVILDPERGGRIASLQVHGYELLVEAGANGGDLDWGCFVMAPYAGRIRDGRFRYAGKEHQLPRNAPPHAIHGTVYDHLWKVEHAEATDAVLVADLGDDWPFAGRVVHRVRVAEERLELRLEVWAEDVSFPASCGWHPWWRRQLSKGDPLELDVDAGAVWARGPDGIPTGELGPVPPGPWDDCFTELTRPPLLRWPGALEVSIDSSCMDVVIYDEPAHAVCVEPQSGPPDALRLTPVVVEPGLPLVAEATFRWRVLA